MQTIGIALPKSLSPEICNEISKRVCYCDSAIIASNYSATMHRIDIGYSDDNSRDKIAATAQRLIDKMSLERNTPTKTLVARNGKNAALSTGVIEGLIADEDIFAEGVGVVSRGGNFLELLLRLDRLFETLAISQFSARKKNYNTLIPSDWLRRAGYFTSFAHSVTFAMHLREGYDNIDNFATRHKDGKPLSFSTVEELSVPEYCLSPALCYHTYGGMEGYRLIGADEGVKTFTAMGRCFRYESKNITALDRLWEFSMREIVFIGEKERVLAMRSKSIELFWKLVEILDLSAKIETASDPFFSTEFKSLRYFQMLNDLKYELLLPVKTDRQIAAASFNYHEHFFGNKFDIKTAGNEAAHTACTAFGLERFAYALLAQIGYAESMEKLDVAEKELANYASN